MMSALLVTLLVSCFVFGVGVCVPTPRRESTTTFLRLTALRSDEGVWSARFGDYEISIELRHHPKTTQDSEGNDTWTLKVRHTSKKFVLPEVRTNSENEILGDVFEEQFQTPTAAAWRQITDGLDEVKENNIKAFKRVNTPRKSKKVKTRRQLSTKSPETSTEKTYEPKLITEEAAEEEEAAGVVMRELAQGNTRINVAFDTADDDTKSSEKIDNFKEMNEDSWGNIAAVIYDGVPRSFDLTTSSPFTDDKDDEHEKLTDAYALPLVQASNNEDYGDIKLPTLAEDLVTPKNYDPTTWKIPEDVSVVDQAGGPNTNNSSSEVVEVVRSSEEVEVGSDYVIEDQTTREDASESSEVDFSDFEASPEMKRIMEWYPRSKPLTTENNGYKLFAGVGWYKLVPWAERWSNARKVCESEMAHLAIPDTEEKANIFLKIFKNYPDVLEQSILSNQVYVGVHSMKRNFTTVLNEPFDPDFPIWFPGEPDNADPGEECVTFHSEGKLRDVPCFYNLPFLCEKEPDIS